MIIATRPTAPRGTSLKSLINGFVLTKQTEGKSPRTVEFYAENLKRFLWYSQQKAWPDDIRMLTEWDILDNLLPIPGFVISILRNTLSVARDGGPGPYYESYTYNEIGNIMSRNGIAYTYGTKPHAVTSVGSVTYTYDANGNMITRSDQTLTWDAENRLIAVTQNGSTIAQFFYDGDGNRIKKIENGETIIYVNLYYERNLTSGNATSSYYLGGRLVATRENEVLRYVHQDHLTGTSLMTDASGAQIGKTMKYLPFGETLSGTVPMDKKFTGQRLDATGLYYYNARYYDVIIGRFISADTIIPNPANPQCFNRYSYCLNNPLKYIDPSGHDAMLELYNWFKEQGEPPPVYLVEYAEQEQRSALEGIVEKPQPKLPGLPLTIDPKLVKLPIILMENYYPIEFLSTVEYPNTPYLEYERDGLAIEIYHTRGTDDFIRVGAFEVYVEPDILGNILTNTAWTLDDFWQVFDQMGARNKPAVESLRIYALFGDVDPAFGKGCSRYEIYHTTNDLHATFLNLTWATFPAGAIIPYSGYHGPM